MKLGYTESMTISFPVGDVSETYKSMQFMSSYQAYRKNLMQDSGLALLYAFYAPQPKQELANRYFFLLVNDEIDYDPQVRNQEADDISQNILFPLLGGKLEGLTPIFGREDHLRKTLAKSTKIYDYHRDIVLLKEGYANSNAIIRKAMPYVRLQDFTHDKITYTSFAFDTLCFADETSSTSSKQFWKGIFDGYYITNKDIDENAAAINMYDQIGFPTMLENNNKAGYFETFQNLRSKSPVTVLIQEHIQPNMTLTDFSKFSYKQFRLGSSRQKGVDLMPGDILQLKNQRFSYENDTLFMFEPDLGATGLKITWDPATMSLRNNDLLLIDVQKEQKKISNKDSQFFDSRLKNFCIHIVGTGEGDLTGKILEINKKWIICTYSFDKHKYQDQFVCLYTSIDKDKIASKGQCDAYGGIWDRLCKSDMECPHFLPGQNWGCTNGYCDMPLNVKRKGFRYEEISNNSYPMVCKGVVDPEYARECYEKFRQSQSSSFSFPSPSP